ncbi:MAG: phage terminase large subunit [Petrotogales bacterium]
MNNRSLFNFLTYFWDEYSNDEFVPNWHIPFLCKELEYVAYRVANKKTRDYDLIINIPPGTTKTALVSIFWPLWIWTKWHWMKFITSSYSGSLSLESAEYSRDIMRSQKFKMLYPELDLRPDKDTKTNFKLIKKHYNYSKGVQPVIMQGGNRFSTSVGGTVTGFHGHINIVDDPIDPTAALSEKEIKSTNHWISQTLSMRKADKRVTTTVVIMQRLHQNDPSGYMLNEPDRKVRHICLPGEIRNYKQQLNPPELEENYVDDLLDPIRMPWEVMKNMKAELGQYGYAGQIGQKPTPPGGGMFQIENFQTVDQNVDPKLIEYIVRYWDKAATAKVDAPYTAGVKIARLRGGKYLVMDVKRGQWSADKREKMIDDTAAADGNHVHIFVEQEPGSGGKESAQITEQRLKNKGFSCFADRPQGDKIFRADPFSVQVNEGNVWLMRAHWNREYVNEFEHFPYGTWKDQVDASSGAFAKLIGKKVARLF